jgi:phosphatidylinositol kinase/protein kinase (PI-3  family)
VTSSSSGLIEFVPDTISLDSLKKMFPKDTTTEWNLKMFFERYFVTNYEEA